MTASRGARARSATPSLAARAFATRVSADAPAAPRRTFIVVDRKRNLDDIEVRVEVDEALFSDVMGDMVRFQRKVAERIQAELGLRARVTLVEPGANARTAGATRRVLDPRQDA